MEMSMEMSDDVRRYISVVCEDFDGSPGICITVARFGIDEMKRAVDLLIAIAKENGSARIEYEEF